VKKLLYYLKIHGDVRQNGADIRLTTRWRGWRPSTPPHSGGRVCSVTTEESRLATRTGHG
jgi:hypothetical protein